MLQSFFTSFENTGSFSKLFLDYISENESLSSYYTYPSKLESFAAQIQALQNLPYPRKLLKEVLLQQYAGIEMPIFVKQNIEAFTGANTFTVCTGHQLNIFTGPLYFIYKIISTIRLSQILKDHYPAYHFVPVYWMASEDHDLEEISSFQLFGKTYSWQTSQTGAVGRMALQGLETLLAELPEKPALFQKAYEEFDTLSAATRFIVNELFGKYGLVCLDADHTAYKAEFSKIVQHELIHQSSFQYVQKTSASLQEAKYTVQVNPREINLFWLEDTLRERIVFENGTYEVLNTSLQFSEAQILETLSKHPEKFSPNVILRPVYQQVLLPNLAYIGGPGELAYWLQLKENFDFLARQVDERAVFPILMPRNFALYINKNNAQKFQKLGLQPEDLFLSEATLKKKWLDENSSHVLDLEAERQALQEVFQQITSKALPIDKSLEGAIAAEAQKQLKAIDGLEKRLQKAEERNQETKLSQLFSLKQKLFPEGKLQERYENFLSFYLNNPDWIDNLMEHFDPFRQQMQIIVEE